MKITQSIKEINSALTGRWAPRPEWSDQTEKEWRKTVEKNVGTMQFFPDGTCRIFLHKGRFRIEKWASVTLLKIIFPPRRKDQMLLVIREIHPWHIVLMSIDGPGPSEELSMLRLPHPDFPGVE